MRLTNYANRINGMLRNRKNDLTLIIVLTFFLLFQGCDRSSVNDNSEFSQSHRVDNAKILDEIKLLDKAYNRENAMRYYRIIEPDMKFTPEPDYDIARLVDCDNRLESDRNDKNISVAISYGYNNAYPNYLREFNVVIYSRNPYEGEVKKSVEHSIEIEMRAFIMKFFSEKIANHIIATPDIKWYNNKNEINSEYTANATFSTYYLEYTIRYSEVDGSDIPAVHCTLTIYDRAAYMQKMRQIKSMLPRNPLGSGWRGR